MHLLNRFSESREILRQVRALPEGRHRFNPRASSLLSCIAEYAYRRNCAEEALHND